MHHVTTQNEWSVVLDILKEIYFCYLPVFSLCDSFITRVLLLSFVQTVDDGASFAEEEITIPLLNLKSCPFVHKK